MPNLTKKKLFVLKYGINVIKQALLAIFFFFFFFGGGGGGHNDSRAFEAAGNFTQEKFPLKTFV